MRSLQHVFWRAAMACGLLALGVGGGFGLQEAPAQAAVLTPACEAEGTQAGILPVVDDGAVAQAAGERIVLRVVEAG